MKKNTFLVEEIIPKKPRKRFPMYTGEWTLNSIYIYLHAYINALEKHGFREDKHLDFSYFNEFIKNILGFSSSTVGWKNMIIAKSLGYKKSKKHWCWEDIIKREKTMTYKEHIKSTDMFFQLFDKFYSLTLKEFYILKMSKFKPKFFINIKKGKTFGIGFNRSIYDISPSYDICVLKKYKNSYIIYYNFSSFEKTDFTKKENYHQFNTIYKALDFLNSKNRFIDKKLVEIKDKSKILIIKEVMRKL